MAKQLSGKCALFRFSRKIIRIKKIFVCSKLKSHFTNGRLATEFPHEKGIPQLTIFVVMKERFWAKLYCPALSKLVVEY